MQNNQDKQALYLLQETGLDRCNLKVSNEATFKPWIFLTKRSMTYIQSYQLVFKNCYDSADNLY